MLIRIKQNYKGIEHYFETGQKKDRELDRDELDKRVPLSGDLESFSRAIQFTRDNKKWTNHYWHITGSFALQNQDISDDDIRKIHREMMEYYFCRYEADNIIHATELHRPKFQTGALGQQRLLHFHQAASKLDTVTGNQLKMTPYRHSADKAFQSYLALRYGLEDPALNRRQFGTPSLEEMITRQTGEMFVNGLDKLTLPQYKEGICQLLGGVESVEDAKKILKAQKDITSVVFKQHLQKEKDPITGEFTGRKIPGNKYLQIKSSLFPKIKKINLQGKSFEELEKLYYSPEELEDRIAKGNYKPLKTPKHWTAYSDEERKTAIATQRAIFEKHRQWWIREGIKDEQRLKKPIRRDLKALEKRCEAKFVKRAKEQRVYFVIYRTNICIEHVQGYRIWENNNTRYLFNNDLGIKIYDRPDKISVRIPDDPEKRRQAVALSLEIAMAKGWDLRKMRSTGSHAFIQETKRQVAALAAAGKLDQAPQLAPAEVAPAEKKPYLNTVDHLQAEAEEKRTVNLLPKERINKIKKELNPESVIALAEKEWGLATVHYHAVKGNKIRDKRIDKAWGVVDFLQKVCNQHITEVFSRLDELLKDQEHKIQNRREQYAAFEKQEEAIDRFDAEMERQNEAEASDLEGQPQREDGQEEDYGPRI